MNVLSGAARMWYRHTFQLKRSTGFYDRGHYVRLDSQQSWHKGNFMALGQEQLERLPEGSRANGSLTLYTDADMVTSESPNQPADRILWNGVEYEVSSGQQWSSHRWYIVTKVGQ